MEQTTNNFSVGDLVVIKSLYFWTKDRVLIKYDLLSEGYLEYARCIDRIHKIETLDSTPYKLAYGIKIPEYTDGLWYLFDQNLEPAFTC